MPRPAPRPPNGQQSPQPALRRSSTTAPQPAGLVPEPENVTTSRPSAVSQPASSTVQFRRPPNRKRTRQARRRPTRRSSPPAGHSMTAADPRLRCGTTPAPRRCRSSHRQGGADRREHHARSSPAPSPPVVVAAARRATRSPSRSGGRPSRGLVGGPGRDRRWLPPRRWRRRGLPAAAFHSYPLPLVTTVSRCATANGNVLSARSLATCLRHHRHPPSSPTTSWSP